MDVRILRKGLVSHNAECDTHRPPQRTTSTVSEVEPKKTSHDAEEMGLRSLAYSVLSSGPPASRTVPSRAMMAGRSSQ